ncbi:hypothetical protein D9611_001993 [Ephemerocybe angulata]|uniref:C2H2-type domain-containing protein n=1 Tax=Ephemerocybe angulata TaxID=980116 RepID=A0A8H5CH61_9AGAR|nr:hypothetical protein D9611_001993 [Tulosesus angulatus]
MDSTSPHSFIEDAFLKISLDGIAPSLGLASANKRHAIFLPSRMADTLVDPTILQWPPAEAQLSPADGPSGDDCDDARSADYSCWSFSIEGLRNTKPRRHSTASSYSLSLSTPAQQLASRYRAGMPLEAVLASSFSSNTSWSSYDEDVMADTCGPPVPPKDYVPVAGDEELNPTRCQSRMDALQETHREALLYMTTQGVDEMDAIICGRPGCGDVVRNLYALMRHLHIHNLHDNYAHFPEDASCRCGAACASEQDHSANVCRRRCRRNSAPNCANPIKETFFKVINTVLA